VVARGTLDFYRERGTLQFAVESFEPVGAGALQLAFEQLKKRLAEEGLFAQERKRQLPAYPRRIGIVTSPQGAVIRDMLNVLGRRMPGLHIRLYPAQVQGAGAAEQICEGLRFFSESGWPDVVIVGRGGGSLEDLWCFNEEAVARAIVASRVPVVAAVGHETDFTIADFAADLRAPTPSAAAELVTGTQRSLMDRIDGAEGKLTRGMRHRLTAASERLHRNGIDRARTTLYRMIGKSQQRVDGVEIQVREHLRRAITIRKERLQKLEARLERCDLRRRFAEQHRRLDAGATALQDRIQKLLILRQQQWDRAATKLEQLSPLTVLDRGYAIVQREDGHVVKDPSEAPPETALEIRVARGRFGAYSRR
jgi:exodeoxyribonuclease VII large subunit